MLNACDHFTVIMDRIHVLGSCAVVVAAASAGALLWTQMQVWC